jgi:hypothetical protein
MIDEIASHREELRALCRRFHVRRLDLFGSAARGDFDPEHSDVDFIVEFERDAPLHPFDAYFGLNPHSPDEAGILSALATIMG